VRTVKIEKMTGGNTQDLKSVKKVDLGKCPPCRRSLNPHSRRANYRVAQWKRSHIVSPDIPLPSPQHGWVWENGLLEPVWSDGPVLPESLYDIVTSTTNELTEDSDSDDLVSLDGLFYSSECDSDID